MSSYSIFYNHNFMKQSLRENWEQSKDVITSVCTNYQELLASDDFLRVINISLRGTDFIWDAILKYFQVLKEWNWLTDREKANLKSFLENGNVRKAVVWLLNKFSQSPLPATENLNQSKQYNAFLEKLFWENGFDAAVSWISQIAEIDARKAVISETLDLTKEVQTRKSAWSELAKTLGTDESKVNITNNGINIDWVANFELNDSEDASYEELEKWEKGGLERIPPQEVWIKLYEFMKEWTREQKQTFLAQVMWMKVPNKIGEKSKYISQSKDSDKMIQRLTISSSIFWYKARSYITTSLFVRRIKN